LHGVHEWNVVRQRNVHADVQRGDVPLGVLCGRSLPFRRDGDPVWNRRRGLQRVRVELELRRQRVHPAVYGELVPWRLLRERRVCGAFAHELRGERRGVYVVQHADG
jgi:hypothetical protein